MKSSEKIWFTMLIIGICSLIIWGGLRIVSAISFSNNCEGYLKRAADSSTVELAQKELYKAMKYLAANDLTHGQTNMFTRNPENDIEFWYTNLDTSANELLQVKPEASQLEKSNILIKLRETLLDSKKGDVKVTHPSGISIYPHNKLFFFWVCLSIGLIALPGYKLYW